MEQTETARRTLIEIPRIQERVVDRPPILWEAGTVDGIPTGIGGRALDPEWVPVRIADSGTIVICEAKQPIAIEIARYFLKTPIRASGQGRWVHDDDKKDGVRSSWQKVKIDRQIVAIAQVTRCDRIVTGDPDVEKIAGGRDRSDVRLGT